MKRIMKNDLSKQKISHFCSNFQGQVIVKPEISSTQSYAKQILARTVPERGLLVVANQQNAGYGKFGRPFYSPVDSGIYMTIVFPHKSPIELRHGGLFTTGIGVAVVNALQESYPALPVQLKWVNDVYLFGKKIGGILCESVYQVREGLYCYVIGIGLNINVEAFPRSLSQVAGTIVDRDVNRNRLIAGIVDQVVRINSDYQSGNFLEQYRRYNYLSRRKVKIVRGADQLIGRVCAIDDQARLVVEDQNGKKWSLSSGEVTKVYCE